MGYTICVAIGVFGGCFAIFDLIRNYRKEKKRDKWLKEEFGDGVYKVGEIGK